MTSQHHCTVPWFNCELAAIHSREFQKFLKNFIPILELKFIYSEKATKFCEISTLLLSYVVPVKSKVKISQNFVAFSEYELYKKHAISERILIHCETVQTRIVALNYSAKRSVTNGLKYPASVAMGTKSFLNSHLQFNFLQF